MRRFAEIWRKCSSNPGLWLHIKTDMLVQSELQPVVQIHFDQISTQREEEISYKLLVYNTLVYVQVYVQVFILMFWFGIPELTNSLFFHTVFPCCSISAFFRNVIKSIETMINFSELYLFYLQIQYITNALLMFQ